MKMDQTKRIEILNDIEKKIVRLKEKIEYGEDLSSIHENYITENMIQVYL